MHYRELLTEDGSTSGTFYHVTTKNRLKSIIATGLDPHGRHRRWNGRFGAKLGDRGYVHLISDYSHAVRWAAKMDYDWRTDGKDAQVVILVVHDVTGLEPDPNIEGQIAGHSWYRTREVVPPENIVKVIPLTQDMIKQVVNGGTAEPPAEPAAEPTQSVPERLG